MKSRIPILLNDDTHEALRTLAHREYRDIRSQATICVMESLRARGLLAASEGVIDTNEITYIDPLTGA